MSDTIEEARVESGLEERATWSTEYKNNLPDSSFLYIEPGGKKDSEGKTVPRSLRHLPYKDANGKIDQGHLDAAGSRLAQENTGSTGGETWLTDSLRKTLLAKVNKLKGSQDRQMDSADFGSLMACANCGHDATDHDEADGGCSDCDCDGWSANAINDNGLELRYAVSPVTHVDVREPGETGDGSWTMSGYAAVFNQETILHDGSLTRVTEAIDPHAFDRVLQTQGITTRQGVIHLNIGHDMNRCVAATDVPAGQPGSLQLRADPHGLFFLARVPTDDPDGIALASKLRSGVFKQASFAFKVAKAEESSQRMQDGRWVDHQRIMDISRVRDVCIAGQGAYSETVAQLRTMAAALGEPGLEPGRRDSSALRGVERTVSPATGVGERRRMLAEMARESARYVKAR
jgi:HK97 family phage prohead protease